MKERVVARQCGDEHVLRGREPLQMGWYELASTLVPGKTVLDVGCGSGEGLRLLAAKAKKAVGIDLDERLKRHDLEIELKEISQIPDKSFDVVTCIDVIEHVKDDKGFVQQLKRVARETVFISTPNYALGRNLHPFHYREYTPIEFERLVSPIGRLTILGGSLSGESRKELKQKMIYYCVNQLYCFKTTLILAKILKRLLLMKVWPHQAVIATVVESSN